MIPNDFMLYGIGFGLVFIAMFGGVVLRVIFKKPVQWADLPVPSTKKKRRGVRKYNPDLKGKGSDKIAEPPVAADGSQSKGNIDSNDSALLYLPAKTLLGQG